MTRLTDLERMNPNIRSQWSAWRQQRLTSNEDANDYGAFRKHLQGMGAPDPGEEPFEEWVAQAHDYNRDSLRPTPPAGTSHAVEER